jgi:tRNA modification GTPase
VVPRHRAAVASIHEAIVMALSLLHEAQAAGLTPKQDELIADALRQALDAVGTLVGRIDADEVLGRIFATFCVGK